MSVDDLEFLVKIVAVGFTDRDLCCSEVEFVAFDLADAAEVDDVGTVGSGEMCGQEWDELGEGHEIDRHGEVAVINFKEIDLRQRLAALSALLAWPCGSQPVSREEAHVTQLRCSRRRKVVR